MHRGLKTANILVTTDWRAKICGLDRAIPETQIVTNTKYNYDQGTEWIAPEVAISYHSLPQLLFQIIESIHHIGSIETSLRPTSGRVFVWPDRMEGHDMH